MHAAIPLLILILAYIGMAAGRIAWLQVDRTGIALLAVIALLASGQMTLDDFGSTIDLPSLVLLFAMMIVSAQFAESGFLDRCARAITESRRSNAALLGLTVAIGGTLSAFLANDILLIAITPLVISGTERRGLDPRPFVIALAAATNAGSAATLIGNAQNILIGEAGRLDFWRFTAICGVPALAAMAIVFGVIWLQWHDRMAETVLARTGEAAPVRTRTLDRNQTIKGFVALAALLALFATPLQREIGALIIAALLLANRKITSRTMIATVDWPLLLLVGCLFAITGSLNRTGLSAQFLDFAMNYGLLPSGLVLLLPYSLVTSNAIGNVPGSMLLLQLWPAAPPGVLYSLALLSTLSGNLLLNGSLTNILIAERAERLGVPLGFGLHARSGVPIALLSVGIAGLWLVLTGTLPVLPVLSESGGIEPYVP